MQTNEMGECMVEHHTHYKEIHGFDRTVWLTVSEHRRLHSKLRHEGNCNVPSVELKKISKAAYSRTVKGHKIHNEGNLEYSNKHYQQHEFWDTVTENILHVETIRYNDKTGVVIVNARFKANHGKKLLMVDI